MSRITDLFDQRLGQYCTEDGTVSPHIREQILEFVNSEGGQYLLLLLDSWIMRDILDSHEYIMSSSRQIDAENSIPIDPRVIEVQKLILSGRAAGLQLVQSYLLHQLSSESFLNKIVDNEPGEQVP